MDIVLKNKFDMPMNKFANLPILITLQRLFHFLNKDILKLISQNYQHISTLAH